MGLLGFLKVFKSLKLRFVKPCSTSRPCMCNKISSFNVLDAAIAVAIRSVCLSVTLVIHA